MSCDSSSDSSEMHSAPFLTFCVTSWYSYGLTMTAYLAIKAIQHAYLNVQYTDDIILHCDLARSIPALPLKTS